MPFYLGKRPQGDLVRFHSPTTPTKASHGHLYTSGIGPFKSKVGASYYARYGQNNPALRTPDDVERAARADPRMEQAIIEESLSAKELSIARECDATDQLENSPKPISQGAIPCPIKLNINA
jgi:hypothetical protein